MDGARTPGPLRPSQPSEEWVVQLPPSPTLKRRPHTPGSARRTDHQLNGSTSPASTGSRPETPLLPRDVGHQPASTLEGHTSWAGPVPSIIRLLLGTICGLILLALFLGFDGSTISVMIASLGQNTGGRAEEIRRTHTTATEVIARRAAGAVAGDPHACDRRRDAAG